MSNRNLTKVEFDRLKQHVYQALHGLERSLESCPDLQSLSVKLDDGHELLPNEIIRWLTAVRADLWKYGPPDVQSRHIKSVLQESLRLQSPERQ